MPGATAESSVNLFENKIDFGVRLFVKESMRPFFFINYRQDDVSAEALLVRKALAEQHGLESVFLDTHSIEPGVVWPAEIEKKLEMATVVISIIGPNWLRVGSDEWGRRRIDQESDWVRRELETALQRRQKIIPLMVNGGRMPPADALPPSLEMLPKIECISVRREYWDHDIKLLLANVGQLGHEREVACGLSPYPVSKQIPPAKLPVQTLDRVLEHELSHWKLEASSLPADPTITREELHQRFYFKRFADAISFMEQVSAGCRIANHHPRWENIFRVVDVYLSTWDGSLHGVSDRDVQLARYFDRAYSEFPGSMTSEEVLAYIAQRGATNPKP